MDPNFSQCDWVPTGEINTLAFSSVTPNPDFGTVLLSQDFSSDASRILLCRVPGTKVVAEVQLVESVNSTRGTCHTIAGSVGTKKSLVQELSELRGRQSSSVLQHVELDPIWVDAWSNEHNISTQSNTLNLHRRTKL